MKKLAAIILTIIFAFSGITSFAYNPGSLEQLGLDMAEDEASFVLRKSFIKNLMAFIDMPQSSDSAKIFNDITEETEELGAISAAYDMGLIAGNDKMLFEPDLPVTYEQAIETMLRLLDYGPYLNMGKSYNIVASGIGLTRGVSFKGDAWLTYGDMDKLFENLIEIPTLDIEFDGRRYSYNKNGKTLLEKYRYTELRKGIVQAVGELAIEENMRVKGDRIVIGGEVYYTKGRDLTEYIGMRVKFLCSEYGSSYGIDYIVPSNSENTVISLKDIELYNMTLKNVSTNEKYSIHSDTFICYNGYPVSKFDKSIFSGDNGNVRIVSNDGSSSCDAVIITEYDDYLVGKVDTVNKIIYDKYRKNADSSESSIDLSLLDEEKIVNAKGKQTEFKSIEKDTVVSVMKDDLGTPKKAIVINKKEEGVVTSLSLDENIVELDGSEYFFTDAALQNELECGDSIVAYINPIGNAAGFDNNGKEAVRYGILMNLARDNDIRKDAAKILNTDNEIHTYILSNKLKFNGVRKSYEAKDIRPVFCDENGFLPQLVRYAINSKGELYFLDSSGSDNEDGDPALVNIYAKGTALKYNRNARSFGSQLLITSSAVVFKIPDESAADKRGKYEDKKYTATDSQKLVNNTNYVVAAYAVDSRDFTPEAFVIYDASASGGDMYDAERCSVVKGISYARDDDDNFVPYIEYVYNGGVYKSRVENDEVISDCLPEGVELKVGDAVRLGFNENNNISYMDYVYSIDEITDDTLSGLEISGKTLYELTKNDYYVFSLGHVYIYKDGAIFFAKKANILADPSLGLDNLAAFNLTGVDITVYDASEKDKVSVGSLNELVETSGTQPGDYALIKTYLGALQSIYIIRK